MATIEINRGTTYSKNLKVEDSSGNAVDITGWTILFTIKLESDVDITDSKALLTKSITSFDNPTEGTTLFKLEPSETRISYGDYVFDYKLIDTSGDVMTTNIELVTITDVVTNREN